MPESGTYGSVRGVPGNGHRYRDPQVLGGLHYEYAPQAAARDRFIAEDVAAETRPSNVNSTCSEAIFEMHLRASVVGDAPLDSEEG
jgi:hypothetical protein